VKITVTMTLLSISRTAHYNTTEYAKIIIFVNTSISNYFLPCSTIIIDVLFMVKFSFFGCKKSVLEFPLRSINISKW
jgi:hypothetical protein